MNEPAINRAAAQRAAEEMDQLVRELHDATAEAMADTVSLDTNRDFAKLFVQRMALATTALRLATAHRELSFTIDPTTVVGD